MSVSAVIVAKNEADDLPGCLASVAWAEERLVVDTGSCDATREVASAAGARVLQHEWMGYGATKNRAFANATGDWILSLDADERVSSTLRDEIQAVTRDGSPHAAYKMPRRLHFMGRWLKHGGCYPDWQVRLFLRDRAAYGAELIHERLQVSGTIGRLKGHLDHLSCATLSEFLRKLDEYSTLWANQAHAQGRRTRWRHSLSLPVGFLGRYLLKAGFMDGRAGLNWALLGGMHSYFKYAKLTELGAAARRSND